MATKNETAQRPSVTAGKGKQIVRPSAEGTNDWLDDIAETVTAATKLLNEQITKNPTAKPEFMPVLEQLVHLSLRMITMRHDVAVGQPPRGPVDIGGGSADDGGMEARIAALEKDMTTVKTDVAVIRSNYVTKEDLHKELHAMTWKIFGCASLLTGVVFYIAKYVH